jgi:anti-sigma factor RsiW
MDWNCTLTEERLSDFLEGSLAASDAAALAAHKETCARCANLVTQVGALLNEMHRMEPLEAPDNLQEKILETTLGRRAKKERSRGWFGWVPLLWQPRFAVGIATVAACCLAVVEAGGLTPGRLRHANLNPADMLRVVNRQAHLTYARVAKSVNELRVVYEIQSRLEETPAQQPPPRSQQDQKPDSRDPQQKSQTHRGRNASRGGVVYAQDLPAQTLKPADCFVTNGPNWSSP